MNKAFTLIELLVSAAIISILASISMANFQEYRTQAYNISAKKFIKDYAVDINNLTCSQNGGSVSYSNFTPVQLELQNAGHRKGIRLSTNSHLSMTSPPTLWHCYCAFHTKGNEIYTWSVHTNSIQKSSGNTIAECTAKLSVDCPSGLAPRYPIKCSVS